MFVRDRPFPGKACGGSVSTERAHAALRLARIAQVVPQSAGERVPSVRLVVGSPAPKRPRAASASA